MTLKMDILVSIGSSCCTAMLDGTAVIRVSSAFADGQILATTYIKYKGGTAKHSVVCVNFV
jgi:hypothetical protein